MSGADTATVGTRIRRRIVDDPLLQSTPPSRAAVRSAVARAVREEGMLLPAEQLAATVRELTDELVGLGPLEALLRDPAVTDVMVNGPDDIWVERAGVLAPTTAAFTDAAGVRAVVARAIGPLGLRLDRARPFVDARLPDGSRLHAVIPPLTSTPVVTIRRFASVALTWDDLAADGAVPPGAAALLRHAVVARRAIVVCGRTGTGKTTLLNLLMADVGPDERVVVIEDAPELRPPCRNLVRLEARAANAEGAGEVTIRDLVRQSLRMRPDRIVVGEVRGTEVTDVLQALATGHEGCMTTVHARAADEAVVRLEGMALQAGLPLPAARAQLRVALDVVAVMGRGPHGRRGLVEVAETDPGGGDGPVTTRTLWRRESWS